MKKPNKHITRLVVWTVSGSLLTSSCVNIVPELPSAQMEQELSDIGLPAIHVNLSDEQSEYFNYVSELAQRIISDRTFAKEFNSNPKKYLLTRSSDTDFDIIITDEALMRITTALADDEIADAIERQDIKQYIRLMHKKGLLENTASDYANILSISEKRQILQSLGVTNISDAEIDQMAIATVVWLFYIDVVAVSYAGVAYTAVAAANVAAGLTIIAGAAAAVKTKVSGFKSIQISKNFDVYMLASNSKKIIIGSDEINRVVEDAIDIYKELYAKDAQQIDTQKLKQTVNLNLSRQPIIANNIPIVEK